MTMTEQVVCVVVPFLALAHRSTSQVPATSRLEKAYTLLSAHLNVEDYMDSLGIDICHPYLPHMRGDCDPCAYVTRSPLRIFTNGKRNSRRRP